MADKFLIAGVLVFCHLLPSVSALADEASGTILTIVLPPEAKLYFKGELAKGSGAVRKFTLPNLTPGQEYVYDLAIEYTEDDDTVTRKRSVKFKGGEPFNVDFIKSRAVAQQEAPAPPRRKSTRYGIDLLTGRRSDEATGLPVDADGYIIEPSQPVTPTAGTSNPAPAPANNDLHIRNIEKEIIDLQVKINPATQQDSENTAWNDKQRQSLENDYNKALAEVEALRQKGETTKALLAGVTVASLKSYLDGATYKKDTGNAQRIRARVAELQKELIDLRGSK